MKRLALLLLVACARSPDEIHTSEEICSLVIKDAILTRVWPVSNVAIVDGVPYTLDATCLARIDEARR